MSPVEIVEGTSPVILGMPHTGTRLPESAFERLNDRGRVLADTDWHIDRLYADLLPGATTVRATFHRYLIDANRDPSGTSLYPGQNTTGLCPTTDFDGAPIWHEGAEPGSDEIAARCENYHAPYHAALAGQIARIKQAHGLAILYDCHSIRAEVPYLFEGVLPDFNIGTNDGKSCAAELEAASVEILSGATGYTHVVNGRFKGGWTTRRYGRPQDRVHAFQMEIAQSTYMLEEPPWSYQAARAEQTRVHLKELLARFELLARTGAL